MYVISINFLNRELKKAINNESLSDNELQEISARMKEKAKKDTKLIAIIMACVVAFILIIGCVSFAKEGHNDAILPTILAMIPGGAFMFGFTWLLQVGIVKFQFNAAVKKHYSKIYEQVKI